MAALIQAKQISKFLACAVAVSGFAFPAAATADVTTAITTALATATDAGTAAAVQVASATQAGVVTSGNNKVEVSDDATGQKLFFEDGAVDREVYGRITEAAGTYTLSLFYTDGANAEQAFTAAATTVSFEIGYQFSFMDFPKDALLRTQVRHLDDVGGGGLSLQQEQVTVTGTDTLAALSVAYVGTGPFLLMVNGKVERFTGTNPSFTVAGTAVTWSAANAGYSLDTNDEVTVAYAT